MEIMAMHRRQRQQQTRRRRRRRSTDLMQIITGAAAFPALFLLLNNFDNNNYSFNSNSFFAEALVSCVPNNPTLGDALCKSKYQTNSHCIPFQDEEEHSSSNSSSMTGTCSNPFASGCLYNYLGSSHFPKKRVCNSQDTEGAAERGECGMVEFDYLEVRILNQNWEGAMFSSWIMQILLSELLGVPATIETGDADASFNFYDPALGFSYGANSYDDDALRTAFNQHDGNCTKFQIERKENGEPYKSCAHVTPEVWSSHKDEADAAVDEGFIEPTTGAGGVGKFSWYIPYFTAKSDPNLLLLGLKSKGGDDLDYRRKIASTFLRPRKWKDYCEEFSADNCANPYYDKAGNIIVTRPPVDEDEGDHYFVPGLFHGHFAATEENDCDKYPLTCTGHIADTPCDWTTYVTGQAYHLGIPVKSSGPGVAGGYSYGSLVEIYHASNYTKSNVLLNWFTPDGTVQKFHGTDAEFMRISLPADSNECKASRNPAAQRCSPYPQDHIGDFLGTCETEAHSYQKAIVSNLKPTVTLNEASRSPAYDAIRNVKISEIQLNDMFQRWLERGVDPWSYDARDAVCSWAAENLSFLEQSIPDTYPRVASNVMSSQDQSASNVALALASITIILVVVVFVLTWKNRNTTIFVYAQRNILFILLFGIALVCVGGILYALVPNDAICIAQSWFTVYGTTLQITPLIVKVAAINKIMKASKNMSRVNITSTTLFRATGVIMALVTIYLVAWTVMDPQLLRRYETLTDEINENGDQIVDVGYACASNSPTWRIMSYVLRYVLEAIAAVLAFENRNVKSAFNESMYLSLVIYSQFLFTLLCSIVWFLRENLGPYTVSTASSYFLTFSAIATLSFYFVPKLVKIYKGKTPEESNSLLDAPPTYETVEEIRKRVGQKWRLSTYESTGTNRSFTTKDADSCATKTTASRTADDPSRIDDRTDLINQLMDLNDSPFDDDDYFHDEGTPETSKTRKSVIIDEFGLMNTIMRMDRPIDDDDDEYDIEERPSRETGDSSDLPPLESTLESTVKVNNVGTATHIPDEDGETIPSNCNSGDNSHMGMGKYEELRERMSLLEKENQSLRREVAMQNEEDYGYLEFLAFLKIDDGCFSRSALPRMNYQPKAAGQSSS